MAVPSAVYLGASVLIGIPAMLILFHALGAAFEVLGWDWFLEPPGAFVILAVSLLIGLQLAVEAAALQLGGIESSGGDRPGSRSLDI